MKTCKRCKLYLSDDCFGKHPKSTCTICENLRKKKWKKENRDKCNFYGKQARYKRRTSPAGKYTKLVLEEKFNYWGNKCWICSTEKNITIDHVKPLSRGGSNWISNIKPCCAQCNSLKNNYWPNNPKNIKRKLFKIVAKVGRKRKESSPTGKFKTCSRCLEFKDLSEFNSHGYKNNKHSLRTDCKDCCAVIRKERYAEKAKQAAKRMSQKYLQLRNSQNKNAVGAVK